MRNTILFVLSASLILSCGSGKQASSSAASPNTLSNKEKKDGWRLLFDGTTKDGWHVFNKKTDGSAWKVADGTLYLDPKAKGPDNAGGGDLITEEEFENFHLKLEWKLAPGGNSGIIFQAKEDPKYRWPWLTGPEMQIIDNDLHADAKNIKHRAGDLYDMITASPENAKPIGEWNLLEIMSKGDQLDLYMNGVKIVTTKQWDDNWRDMIAKSKFKNTQDFGKFSKGKISLQDHGDLVWFRNIKIRNI